MINKMYRKKLSNSVCRQALLTMFSHSTTDIINGVNFLPDTYYTHTRKHLTCCVDYGSVLN